MPAPPLLRDTARQWTVRMPSSVFVLGPPASVLFTALWAVFVDGDTGPHATLAEVIAWTTFGWDAVLGVAIAGSLTGAFTPRVAGSSAVVAALGTSLRPDLPFLWLGVAWLALIALDVALARQQSARWPARASDEEIPDLRLPAWTPLHLGLTTVLLVAALVVLGVWLHVRADLVAFEQRAVTSTGVVVGVDAFENSVRVRVDDRTDDFLVDDPSAYSVGDEVPVTVDPTGEERPVGLGDADPDGWELLSVPFGALVLLGVVVGATHPLRIADLRRRVRRREAVLVRVTDRDRWIDVAAVDDPARAVSRLSHVHVLASSSVLPDDDLDDGPSQVQSALLIGASTHGAPAALRVDLPEGPLWLATVWPARDARRIGAGVAAPTRRTLDPGTRDQPRFRPTRGPRSWLVAHRQRLSRPLLSAPLLAGAAAYGLFGVDVDGWSGSWSWLAGGALTWLAVVGQLHHLTSPLVRRLGSDLVIADEFAELVLPLWALRGVERRGDHLVLDTVDGDLDLPAFWPTTQGAQTELDALVTELSALVGSRAEPFFLPTEPVGRMRPARGLLLGAGCALVWTVVALVASGADLPVLGP